MVCLATLADVAQLAERGHAMAETTSSKLVIRSTSGVRQAAQVHRLVNSAARVPACLAGSRGFDSRTRRQIVLRTSLAQLDQERRPTKPEVARSSRARGAIQAGLAQLAEQWPPKPKVRGSIPWSGARHLDVAKWSKAAACKAAGASPRPFKSDRRVQFISPIAQLAERLAVNQEVRGSKPRRGAISLFSRSSVAEHRLDEAGVDGSFPSACAWVWP
jgi:hypothetical protein